MENILLGGEKELQELKQILQEKQRYNSVLASLDNEVEDKKKKLEDYIQGINSEIQEEVKQHREVVAKPYYDEIASHEVEIQKIINERERQRQVQIDEIVQKETKEYESRKGELDLQMKQVKQEDGVPAICLSRPFLAFFCPRTGKDALVLVVGIILLLLVLPMGLYYGIYGGNDTSVLLMIYLVLIVFFYTAYLLINNLVKDKYLVGLQKILVLMAEKEKLEQEWMVKVKGLENIPDYELELKNFDDEVLRLQLAIGDLNGQKEMELANFDSNERLKMEIAAQVQEKYSSVVAQFRTALDESVNTYEKMQEEFNKFLEDRQVDERYSPLLRLEGSIYDIKVIDELIFYICHGDADNIRAAISKRKRKLGEHPVSY